VNKPTRPALRYHGGKWKLAPWIIEHFPPHKLYVEAFGGGCSVLLQKPRSHGEVYNDLDGRVVDFFRVLRDAELSEQLINSLQLTPFSRDEFDLAYEPTPDRLEAARRLACQAFMSHGSAWHRRKTGFRSKARNEYYVNSSTDWARYPETLRHIVERFQGVVIENRPAVDVMQAQDGDEVLHYLDPPYVPETYKNREEMVYLYDMTREEHEELLKAATTLRGMVIVSGYRCELYDDLLSGWRRFDTEHRADKAKVTVESIWLNRSCLLELSAYQEVLELCD
jgi:DNA adenine methylase